MLLALVAQRRTATNAALAAAAPRGVDARILAPERAVALVQRGAVAVGRIDVSDALDGPEDGLWALGTLAARGVRVLNRTGGLLAAHDKLLTARVLARERLPHPRTTVAHPDEPAPDWDGPVVVKPRFGSWGRDVELCDDELTFRRHLRALESRLWFRRHGAIVQELIPPEGFDLRVIVAGGVAVGAVARVAAPGEWRTNIARGGTRSSVDPPAEALDLAVRAAAAGGVDLAGVDLLPLPDGGYTILELNGAVDFTREYALERDPFVAAAEELARLGRETVSIDPDPLTASGPA
jgi:[lysine-biosynthesis-protein LysW]---L-2-aminoadipate ligase